MRIVISALAMLMWFTPLLRADVDEATEERVRRAIAKALPSVVAVGTGVAQPDRGPYRSMASGVVVSADGLVLSQHHVTHASDRNDPAKSHPAGHKTLVVLHDGREVNAELLGTDATRDLSMLRITDAGPFPFSPIDPKLLPKLGDAVLKLGHPLGHRKDRAALARLGRVVLSEADSFVTDCQVIGGDSGGPFFDSEGRLLGVITGSRTTERLALVSATLPRYRTLPGAWNNATLAERHADLKAGKTVTQGPARELTDPPVLDAARWSRGRDNDKAWRAALAGQSDCVVRVLDGGETVALGTVVEPGLIVTKASLLPLSPKVRRADGTVLEPVLLGAFAWSGQTKRFLPAPLDAVRTPAEYLGGIGLLPVAPGATPEQQRATAGLRLPDALSRLTEVRVRPTADRVEGSNCIVVEGTRADKANGQERQLTERYWFDPAAGYAPRRVEIWDADRLVRRVTAHEFDEVAPGVWLPWDVRSSAGRPGWVKDEPGSPAYTVRVRVRRATVGAVAAKLFQP